MARRLQRIIEKNKISHSLHEKVKVENSAKPADSDPEVKSIWDSTPKRVKANHLFYNSLAAVLEYVDSDFDNPLVKRKYISKKSFCTSLMSDIFDRAERAIWVKNFGEPRGTGTARNIGEKVKAQYLKILTESGYSEDVMKNATEMHEKLKVIYGNEFEVNDDYLEDYYEKLAPHDASFFQIALATEKLKQTQHHRNFRYSELRVFGETNIYSRPPYVQFSVPVMETPFVSPDFPPALNYGRFGFLFAHEWAHALQGLALYRNNKSEQNLECLEDQYSSFKIFGDNITVMEDSLKKITSYSLIKGLGYLGPKLTFVAAR